MCGSYKVHKVWQKYFKNLSNDLKLRAKQIRFLQYRGFTHEQIEYALGSVDTDEP